MEELDVTSNEKEEVTKQIWIAIVIPEVIRDLESCQLKKIFVLEIKI